MWKLIISDDQGQQTVVKLVRDDYAIGRAEGNPIRFTERNVSRRHAVLSRTTNGYRIEDQGSYNGVFVNAVRVIGRHDLAHRDVIQLGDYRVEVIDEALDTQEQGFRDMSTQPNGGGPQGGVNPASGRLPHRLVVLVGPNQGSSFTLEGDRLLIGRGDECEFRLDHASVSRIHAEIRQLDANTFEIIDKGSANGLRINGHERPRALLDGRDVVELGDVVLKYIPEGQVFRADREEGQRIAALSGSPPPPPAGRASRIPTRRALLAAAVGALLVAIVTVTLWPSNDAEVSSVGLDAAPTMANAEKLLSAGDAFGAHRVLTQVPSAQLQTDPELVQRIESAWAEATLRQAQRTQKLEDKRAILDRIARSQSVPARFRKQAVAALNSLEGGAVALDELDAQGLTVREQESGEEATPQVRQGVSSDALQ